MMEKGSLLTNLPLTLETHFEMLAKESTAVENLHRRSVIQAIERFLGEDRIKLLSATPAETDGVSRTPGIPIRIPTRFSVSHRQTRHFAASSLARNSIL